jgi:HK97 family phage portal protein
MGLLSWWRGRTIRLTDGAFWSSYFNGDTWAGESVGTHGALQLAAWWACVRLLSETVATLPLFVYRMGADGSRELDRDHALYGLLHDSPNADQTAVEFWEGQIAALCTAGNGYSEKVFSAGRLVALQPLMPDCVRVRRDPDGALVYDVTDRGRVESFSEDKIFHIRGFGGGDQGLSPVAYARQTLGITVATEKAAGKAFAQGLRASGFFTAPAGAKLTPEQREQFRRTFIDPYVGGDASAKVGLLEAGFDFKPVTISLHDAELLLSRRWNVEEICRWLNVPPILIGHAGQGQTMWGSGVEQIMLGWLTLGLRPYLSRIEQAIAKRLMTPADRNARLKAEFSVEGLLRADSASRAAFLSTMVQNGIYTRNRARALENEPRDPDPMADRLTVQSNLIALSKLGESGADPAAQARSALMSLLGPEIDALVEVRSRTIPQDHSGPLPQDKELAMPALKSSLHRKEASLKIRGFDLQIKAAQDDGTFSGYGSVYGVVDSYNEVVAPGAFDESLAEIAAKGRSVPVLWQLPDVSTHETN